MDVFDRLAEKLDRAALGAPKTGNLLEILRELFTPEEAEVALVLPFRSTPLPKLAEFSGRNAADLRGVLEGMVAKGLIYARSTDRGDYYAQLPVFPGMFELQFMGGERGPAKTRLARLFEDYYVEGMAKAMGNTRTGYARVIPVEREISTAMEIYPYERVSQFIREGETFALATCYCRHEKELLGHACDAPKDVCMVFGPFATFAVERGFARAASRDEMAAALDRAEEHGLVHVSDNVADRINFLCNCCGCCCGFLRTITELGRANVVATSRFVALKEMTLCSECGACVERCQVGALAEREGEIHLDALRCLGCGSCVGACPTEALTLIPREHHRPPLASRAELDARIRAERGFRRDTSEHSGP